MLDTKKKTVAVFGMGVIGCAVTEALERGGYKVIKVAHLLKHQKRLMEKYPKEECYFADVEKDNEVEFVANQLRLLRIDVDDVIYTVGKYGKGGYLNRAEKTILFLEPRVIHEEIAAQFYGFISVSRYMLPRMTAGGSFVFVSSVAHENLSHKIISYAQQELLIKYLREDPAVLAHRTKIHHVGFTGIATNYYEGADECINVHSLHSIEFAVEEIISTLDRSTHLSCKKIPA